MMAEFSSNLSKCAECGFKTGYAILLDCHIEAQHKNTKTIGLMFQCPDCNQQFTQQGQLIKHFLSEHEGVNFACQHCNQKFTRQGLEKHMQFSHIVKPRKQACNQCDKQYTKLTDLRNHIESKHEDMKFECDRCKFTAKSKYIVTRHIQFDHENIRFPCNLCEKVFTKATTLKIHIQSLHRGIKYYSRSSKNID